MTPKDIANVLNIPVDSNLAKFYGEDKVVPEPKEVTGDHDRQKPSPKK